ncbi:MAG TPA: hypothetical protein VM238_20060 [Phycisphaerae bacterium]|nr:hypothetical protein [Phycisphaerae bacterium]
MATVISLNWLWRDMPKASDISDRSGLYAADGNRLKPWGRSYAQWAEQLQATPPCRANARRVVDLAIYCGKQQFRVTGFTACGAPKYDLTRPTTMPIAGMGSADGRFVFSQGDYGANNAKEYCI